MIVTIYLVSVAMAFILQWMEEYYQYGIFAQYRFKAVMAMVVVSLVPILNTMVAITSAYEIYLIFRRT